METLKNHCPLVGKVQSLSVAQRSFVIMSLCLPPASRHRSCIHTSCLHSHTSDRLLQTSQALVFSTMTYPSPICLVISFHLFRLDSGASYIMTYQIPFTQDVSHSSSHFCPHFSTKLCLNRSRLEPRLCHVTLNRSSYRLEDTL